MKLSNEGKTGVPEAIALATMFIGVDVFSAYPARMADLGLSAGWMVSLVSAMVGGLLGVFILGSLMARFPESSIVEIAEEVLGRWLGPVVSVGYVVFFLVLTALTVRQYSERILTVFLPTTPPTAIIVFFLFVIVIGCYLGLETMGRAAVFTFPLVFAAILLPLFLVFPFWNHHNLFPLVGSGPTRVISQGVIQSSLYGQLLVLAAVHPLIRVKQKKYRLWLIVAALSAVILVSASLFTTMVFPVPVLRENLFVMLQAARLIFFGRFVQRIEPIFISFWIIGVLFKMMAGFYITLTLLTRVLKLQYYRPFLFPMAVITFSLALLPPNFMTVINLAMAIFWDWGWIPGFAIPLLLLVMAGMRGKKGVTPGDQIQE